MRKSLPYAALLSLLLLSSCGNGNDGRVFNPKGQPASGSTQSVLTGSSLAHLSSCKVMTVLPGSNPSYASQVYSGVEVCRNSSSSTPAARLKVGAYFPSATRFCLVPWVGSTARPESCFNATGDIDISLDPGAASFTALVLVAESDLNAYKAYVSYSSNIDPPRAIAQMQ